MTRVTLRFFLLNPYLYPLMSIACTQRQKVHCTPRQEHGTFPRSHLTAAHHPNPLGTCLHCARMTTLACSSPTLPPDRGAPPKTARITHVLCPHHAQPCS